MKVKTALEISLLIVAVCYGLYFLGQLAMAPFWVTDFFDWLW